MPEIPRSIAQLPGRADELRDLLISWAEINSGSDNLGGLERMAIALRSELSKFGPSVETVSLPGTAAVALRVRTRPHAPHQILFSGHYDTVYGSDHPFQHCTLVDPKTLNGPGVADMKGGLVVMLAALKAFEETPLSPSVGWEILLSPDEETGSAASGQLIAQAAYRHQLGLVFEPARENGNLVQSRKGTGIFTVTCRGRSAHAGRDPAAGRNAILALSEYLPQASAQVSALPGVLINVGSIRGGGAVNIVPDFAQAEINIRITKSVDEAAVLATLRAAAEPINAREGYSLEIQGRFNRPPKETMPAEERLFKVWQECGASLGASFSWQHVGGGSDGNLLSAAGLPVLDGLGVIGNHLHSENEVADLPSLTQRAQVAALFLHRVASDEIPLGR